MLSTMTNSIAPLHFLFSLTEPCRRFATVSDGCNFCNHQQGRFLKKGMKMTKWNNVDKILKYNNCQAQFLDQVLIRSWSKVIIQVHHPPTHHHVKSLSLSQIWAWLWSSILIYSPLLLNRFIIFTITHSFMNYSCKIK